ncbi:MAG TPA: hypothetical protein VFE05_16715 [Longimicrobiaceae bacterium]|jgi:hypothetical protein|nr:hypothetical protein [Longimicrobiaceae bacterium]
MTTEAMAPRPRERRAAHLVRLAALTGALAFAAPAAAQGGTGADPRVGLRAGWNDAGEAIRNMAMISHTPKPEGFFNPSNSGDFGYINSDLAFRGSLVFMGGYHGVQIYDYSNVSAPVLRGSIACPGGQGDVSVWGNLLFMSVEQTSGRVDCGAQGVQDTVSAERFRGVRIYDISDIARPRQVADVQTCRGSHTHTLVPDPKDPRSIYVYVSGTSVVRSGAELAGCAKSADDPNTSLFRIDVIRVPLNAPQQARIVSQPRVFADPATGAVAGLWKGGNHGEGTQTTSATNMCHDITVYPQLGLAAGACAGNGILLDIRDPAHPVRVADVSDPNFSYWHSATFSNDGSKILFSDEWGGGTAARCRETDRPQWGADAIFRRSGNTLSLAGYYKLPAPQTAEENCVAHNGSLVPVPGRDIQVQAWYQGGISVVDFTDPAHPVELAFFDRGPMDAGKLVLGGFWSAYWYNGHVYGSEIGRGLDVLDLTPSAMLSRNEIEAAKLVHMDRFNPQTQTRMRWPASFVVARAYVDQLARGNGLSADQVSQVRADLDRAEGSGAAARRTALRALSTRIRGYAAGSSDAPRVRMLADAVTALTTARG